MDPTPIYTVTTMRGALAAGSRSVGFFYLKADAERCLAENWGDIYECGYYPFAVIERVEQGIYTVPRSEYWYKWDDKKKGYVPCEKPDRFKQVCGWSLA
jgi:hypothetical protein